MIDHFLDLPSQSDLDDLLERFGPHCSFAARAVLQDAEWDNSDPDNPVLVMPEIVMSNFGIWISLPELSEELRDWPGDACQIIADSSLNVPGAHIEDVAIWLNPNVTPEVLHAARIEPEPFGRDYPWRRPRP